MPASRTPKRAAADLLVECLRAEGCEYVFSVPGEETMDVLEALADHPAVRHITTRHEQGAAFMADVYGRLTGRCAVAMATLGPGATNLVTGVADAYLVTVINWTMATPPIELAKWPAVKAYYERLRTRPSIAKAIAEEFELYKAELARQKSAA